MLYSLLIVITGAAVTFALLAHGAVHWLASKQKRIRRTNIPVSVLKPLKGIDDELEANLTSFCRQTHPRYEIIFGAAEASDPALVVARKVATAHPNLPIKVVVGECPTGLNPKVRVLRALLRSARHEVILISDSNVRVDEHYLANTTAELEDPRVGLVSNPIVGAGHVSFGAKLENWQLNSYVIFGLALTNFIGKYACVVGKSMLMRQSALRQIGGLAKFADVLAEDYLIGRAMRQHGFRVVTCPSAIQTINKSWKVERTLERHLRWAQIRRSLGAPGYVLELLLLPHVLLAATSAVALIQWDGSSRFTLAACAIAYVVTSASEAAATLRWSGAGYASVQFLPFVALRQVGQALLWILAWGKSEVNWRGNRLQIGKGSKLTSADQANARKRSLRRRLPPFARQAA
jgi:ceramide glucosyltransferase